MKKAVLKQFIIFWKKYIEIERNEEKKFHLEQIYNLGRKRVNYKLALLDLKAKKLQQFEDMTLVRFSVTKDKKINFKEFEFKEGEVVLIVDKSFYSLRKLPFNQFQQAVNNFPIWTIADIGKLFIDVWISEPISYWVFKNEVDLHLYVNDITFRRWEEGLDYMLKKRWKDWEMFLKVLLGSGITEDGNKITEDEDIRSQKIIEKVVADEEKSEENLKKPEETNYRQLVQIPEKLTFGFSENTLGKYSDKFLSPIIDNLGENHRQFLERKGIFLNPYQFQFVNKSLGFKWFLLLHWPFGTGKTTTLIATILALISKWYKLLVSADSNIAVDNIVARILDQNLISREKIVRIWTFSKVYWQNIFEISIYHKLLNHSEYKKIKHIDIEIEKIKKQQSIFQKPVPQFRRGLSDVQIVKLAQKNQSYRWLKVKTIQSMSNYIQLQTKINKLIEQKEKIKQKIIDDIIENSKVVFTTNSMCFSDILKTRYFDIAIIDEWSQATLPSTLLPILLADKFIIAWDHKQLPPTVISPKAKPLEKSLFEILVRQVTNNIKSELTFFYPYHLLRIQYRMNEKLMQFPSDIFYNGQLQAGVIVKDISLRDLVWENQWKYICSKDLLYFFNIKGKQQIDYQTKSYYNLEEIDWIIKILNDLFSIGTKQNRIWIISPYAKQVSLLKQYIWDKLWWYNIDVNTIDGYQGKEKEIILISWVRTDWTWFITDPRRFNVAITRVKRMLIHFGNIENLEKNSLFKKYIDFCKSLNLIRSF